MKQFFLVLFVIAAQIGFPQAVSLSQARTMYFSMDIEKSAALKLFNLMEVEIQTSVPVLLAYKGASSAASAGLVDGVTNKFSYFRKGKVDLEKAVRLDPKNPEIRFLRLATQTNAPGFLFYKSDISEDKKIVLEGLFGLFSRKTDKSLALNMAKFLLRFDSLTEKEKLLVKQLYLRYEQND